MTFSYAMRAWTIEQMHKSCLGRETIAMAAGINARTLGSWHRQSIRRLKGGSHYPNEYERAMGILIYQSYKNYLPEIAKKFRTRKRSILKWQTELNEKYLTSDLIRKTHEAYYILRNQVKKDLEIYTIREYLDSFLLWPHPFEVYGRTWKKLDDKMYELIIKELIRRIDYGLYVELKKIDSLKSTLPKVTKTKGIRIVGPSRSRYGVRDVDGKIIEDEYTNATREVGALAGEQMGWVQHYCRMSQYLLGNYEFRL